jgi:hypothetical protein
MSALAIKTTAAKGLQANALKRIALVLADGVGIRNFVLSPFLRECEAEMLLLHRCPEDLILQLGVPDASLEWRTMGEFRDTPLSYTLRQALTFAHVYWGDTLAMRYTRSRSASGSLRTRAASHAARALGRLSASPSGIQRLERAYYRSIEGTDEVKRYRKVFEETKPEMVLSGNHRLPDATAPVLAARSLGIPTVAFVASWDNLTSKGRISAPFDHYLVWSLNMKAELLRFHPHVSAGQVHVVGTPQFDSYGDPGSLWGREEFFRRVNASPDRPLICYSGGDEGTCPEDHKHLRILLDLIRSGAIRHRPQLLLRPSPADSGKRYEQLRKDFPELIYAPPVWHHPKSGEWSGFIPLPEDVQFLANLTAYSDLNVNIASTMTLDFGLHDKPVVNIVYDLSEPPPLRVPLWNLFYSWEHYQPVVKLGAARFAHSPGELALHINSYLDTPAADRDGRRKLSELQVGVPVGESSQRILEVLRSIAR